MFCVAARAGRSWPPAALSYVGHQDGASQPGRPGRVHGDRPGRPRLRGLPRAHAHPASSTATATRSRRSPCSSLELGRRRRLGAPRVAGDARRRPRTDSLSLVAIAAFGLDPEAAMPSLQAQLGFGITEAAVVDDARWAELSAPGRAAPARQPRRRRRRSPPGRSRSPPSRSGPYLAARDPGESPTIAVARQQRASTSLARRRSRLW